MSVASEVVSVFLDRLDLAPENVRKGPSDAEADAELEASIERHGLKQNLIVRAGDERTDPILVVGGGRRLRALRNLAGAGIIAPDEPIPCVFVDERDAREVSLVENTVRESMSTADQIQAFVDLSRDGVTAEEIALRFAFSPGHVARLLRLGSAAPELIEALRAGAIDVETLKAFVLTDDHELQVNVFEQVKGTYQCHANHVRALIAGEAREGDSRLAKFVGIDAYLEAGGAVTRDLFVDEDTGAGIYFEDVSILEALARQKLEAAAAEIEGWKWVDIVFEFGWQARDKYWELTKAGGDPTPEEKERLAEILERQNEIRSDPDNRDEWRALADEADKLRRTAFERRHWTDEQREAAGVMVSVDYGGKLRVDVGLIRPGDKVPRGAKGTGLPAYDPPKTPAQKAGVTRRGADELKEIRGAIVRAELAKAKGFGVLFDLIAFQFAVSALDGYVDIFRVNPEDRRSDLMMKSDEARVAMWAKLDRGLLDGLDATWHTDDDDRGEGESFRAFCELSLPKRKRWFAAALATSFVSQLSTSPHSGAIEVAIARLGIDWAKRARPNADVFWSQCTKARLLEIGAEVLGAQWVEAHRPDPKAKLVRAIDRDFRKRGKTWAMPGLVPDVDAE